MPDRHLAAWRAQFKRPCPRVELWVDNDAARRLALYTFAQSPLATSYALVLAQRFNAEMLDRIYMRVYAALADERIVEALRRQADQVRRAK